MKIYTKIILDKNNNIIEEKYFNYSGPMSYAGIHYDFKSTRGTKAMEKQAKREKKLKKRIVGLLKRYFIIFLRCLKLCLS